MSLVSFHRGLIAVAIVFCIGYGIWELAAFGRTGSDTSLLVGVVFIILGVALAVYLSRLRRFLGYDRGDPGGTTDFGSG